MVMELLNKEGAQATAQEFDGEFFFTNPDTEDFTGFWNSRPYTFEAMKTSKFYILDANPLETQEIRKRFALRLAQRMFGKSAVYKKLEKDSEGKPTPKFFDPAKAYQPYVDQCLKRLPEAKVVIGKKVKKDDIQPKKDPKTGKQVVTVYGEDDQDSMSLVEKAEKGE